MSLEARSRHQLARSQRRGPFLYHRQAVLNGEQRLLHVLEDAEDLIRASTQVIHSLTDFLDSPVGGPNGRGCGDSDGDDDRERDLKDRLGNI